jgi:hypothetical protein
MDFKGGVVTDIAGMRFGRLVVLSFHGIRGHKAFWVCACDCGQRVIVQGKRLRAGHTRSCSCLRNEVAAHRCFRHGRAYLQGRSAGPRIATREYRAWLNMKQRVLNSKSEDYKYYGERGITICDRWRNSFADFFADMGPCPEALELDRIEVDGNYEPGNCRWADELTQARNRRNCGRKNG